VERIRLHPDRHHPYNPMRYTFALDGGQLMQRNDSQGVVSPERAGNTLIGSLMSGGSSGGPWLVNLGIRPALSGTDLGFEAARNIVVGSPAGATSIPRSKNRAPRRSPAATSSRWSRPNAWRCRPPAPEPTGAHPSARGHRRSWPPLAAAPRVRGIRSALSRMAWYMLGVASPERRCGAARSQ
jgi:hypothetical protein